MRRSSESREGPCEKRGRCADVRWNGLDDYNVIEIFFSKIGRRPAGSQASFLGDENRILQNFGPAHR
jgi:hypothetical protein